MKDVNVMNIVNERLNILAVIVLFFLLIAFCSSSCTNPSTSSDNSNKIFESEIIAFQKGYEVSMNGILNVHKNNGDVPLATKNHIEKYYGFDDGKVLFKASQSDKEPFRSTFEGLSSYLIGNNESFPNDKGFALEGWNKIDWRNRGIINDESIAIAIGTATMSDTEGNKMIQNYTMCFKKNEDDELKLIAHKVSSPCN